MQNLISCGDAAMNGLSGLYSEPAFVYQYGINVVVLAGYKNIN